MNAEKLFRIICPEVYKNVTIETEELLDIEDLNGKSPMVFSVLGVAERQLYERSSDKRNFVGSSESIIIYNIEVESYYLIMKEKDISGVHDITMKKLRKYCNLVPSAYVYLTHMLLHELGHYQQYIDREKSVYLYTSWCEKEEREIFNNQQYVTMQIQKRIDKLIPPFGANKSERVMLEKLAREYRNISKEKEADNFAYAQMMQAIEALLAYLENKT